MYYWKLRVISLGLYVRPTNLMSSSLDRVSIFKDESMKPTLHSVIERCARLFFGSSPPPPTLSWLVHSVQIKIRSNFKWRILRWNNNAFNNNMYKYKRCRWFYLGITVWRYVDFVGANRRWSISNIGNSSVYAWSYWASFAGNKRFC